MVWFNVDDGLTTSPKVLAIPRDERLVCIGLWTMAGSWSGQHLTDGEIPAFMLTEWGADLSHGTALVEAGLWQKTAKGYRFHAWKEYQQSRADVEAKREHDRQRKKEYREKMQVKRGNVPPGQSGDKGGTPSGIQAESETPNPSLPFPTQPTLLSTSSSDAEGAGEVFSEDVIRLCDLLAELVRANGHKVGTVGKQWWQACDRLIRLDGYTPDQIEWLARWATADEFWAANIRSMPKLREKFSQLKARALAERKAPVKASTVEHGRSVDQILAERESQPHLRAVTS